jgi:uncharacterized membrane protein
MYGKVLPCIFLAVLFSSTCTSVAAQDNMATVHGTIYDVWTFQPLDNVLIDVYSNSTLQQQILATGGTYSLTLSPDNYTIHAKYYRSALLLYDDEENITLHANDNLTLDLIMFPSGTENIPSENDIFDNGNLLENLPLEEETPILAIAILGLVIAGSAVSGFILLWRKSSRKKVKPALTAQVKVVEIPEDLKKVLDIIVKEGRITQTELRTKLPYSEAKVSLLVADLEDRGLIRKIKKGRGNILILQKK